MSVRVLPAGKKCEYFHFSHSNLHSIETFKSTSALPQKRVFKRSTPYIIVLFIITQPNEKSEKTSKPHLFPPALPQFQKNPFFRYFTSLLWPLFRSFTLYTAIGTNTRTHTPPSRRQALCNKPQENLVILSRNFSTYTRTYTHACGSRLPRRSRRS